MKKIVTLIVAMWVMFVGCYPTVQHPVVHQPTDTPDCSAACSHLRYLTCVEGNPLPDGTTCEQFCQTTQQNGHALTPSCVIHITKCSDMNNLDAFCTAPAPTASH